MASRHFFVVEAGNAAHFFADVFIFREYVCHASYLALCWIYFQCKLQKSSRSQFDIQNIAAMLVSDKDEMAFGSLASSFFHNHIFLLDT